MVDQFIDCLGKGSLQGVIGFRQDRVIQEPKEWVAVIRQQPPGASQVAVGIPPASFGLWVFGSLLE